MKIFLTIQKKRRRNHHFIILAFRGIRGPFNVKDKKQQMPTPNRVYTIAQSTPFLTKGRTCAV